MSGTTSPRTWTLAEEILRNYTWENTGIPTVKVIELEPVLDLLERALRWAPDKPSHWPEHWWAPVTATREQIAALLREHGRLGDGR